MPRMPLTPFQSRSMTPEDIHRSIRDDSSQTVATKLPNVATPVPSKGRACFVGFLGNEWEWVHGQVRLARTNQLTVHRVNQVSGCSVNRQLLCTYI